MASRTIRKFRVGAVVAAVLALSACSGFHPGEAIVINGDAISMSELDEATPAYCKFGAVTAAQQGGGATSGGDARRQAAQSMIVRRVALQVADKLGVSVPPSAYSMTGSDMDQVRKALKSAGVTDLTGVRKALEDSQQTSALLSAIGADKLGVQQNTKDAKQATKLNKAGQKAVLDALKHDDVSIDPRLGLNPSNLQAVGPTGSLSVAASDLAKAKPTALHCS